MNAVTHIYFDWSKTLAIPKTRDIFIATSTLSVLYPDTLFTLKYLYEKGYTLGIISNTHKNPEHFINALSKSGLMKFFKGTIALSSEPALCRKACKKIFKYCLSQDNVLPEHTVMVGDEYQSDVLGGLSVGMNAIYIDRDHDQEPVLKSKSKSKSKSNNQKNPIVITVNELGDICNLF